MLVYFRRSAAIAIVEVTEGRPMATYAEAWRWLAATDHEVMEVVRDLRTWGSWLRLFEVTAAGPPLEAVGDEFTAVGFGTTTPATWRLDRVVRRCLTFVRGYDGAPAGTLVVSLSPWEGGCAAELRAESALAAPLTGMRLRRSLRDLERSVLRGAVAHPLPEIAVVLPRAEPV